MPGTDRIVLRTQPSDTTDQQWAPWPGQWPPPPRLLLVFGALVDPAVQEHTELTEVRAVAALGGPVAEYVRYSFSAMPDPAGDDEHWFRGAEYVLAST